ncbi:trypco2 family protein [Streptomyces sp. NPDC086549]|uniref:trypco2 family protein n=1 Tax=Streptomyces sp. NPDC086549 TaxID=3365752 RepID=UPI00381DBC29
MSGDFEGVQLGDAVQSLRDELLDAAGRGAGQSVRFAVDSIELEFTVELRKGVSGSAGVKAWVVTAGSDVSRTRVDTHHVKLVLRPKDATTGRELEIGSADLGGTANFGRAASANGGGSR